MRKRCFAIILLVGGLFFLRAAALEDWSAAKNLSKTPGQSFSPAIAIDSNNHIHIVSGVTDIYYLRSRNGGTTWSAVKRLAKTPSWSYDAALAIDSSNTIHVAWTDETPGPPEIYYRRGK